MVAEREGGGGGVRGALGPPKSGGEQLSLEQRFRGDIDTRSPSQRFRGDISPSASRFTKELGAFMAAISSIESGGNYGVLGPQTKYGRPRGKYQILDSNWNAWAAEAGIPGADWRDPQAQERVAAHKFTQYYRQFNGNWDAVAVAWFAGPGRAKKWQQGGGSIGGLSDVLGTSVNDYVRKMRDHMMSRLGDAPARGLLDPSFDEAQDAQPLQVRASDTMEKFQRILSGEVHPTENVEV